MTIHIVTLDNDSDQILARLSHEMPGEWTRGKQPDPHAEMNIYMPYILKRDYMNFERTPQAAWFSHREQEDGPSSHKSDIWDMVAQAVDVRTCSALMYLDNLEVYGPTFMVTPPLDRKFFCHKPSVRPREQKRLIGTSGTVYASGRKGPELWDRLATELSGIADFTAIGAGWYGARHLKWAQVPGWYQSLDLYVCTSLIEGIGYGPLEAMACGIPVVIPRGVGIFDELPSVQFMYRYKAGDYGDLKRAVREALAEVEPINTESLRGVTARFTSEAWQSEWRQAVTEFRFGPPAPKDLPHWHGRAGVYCVAYGDPARECAVRLIRSIHKIMPGLPVALASDAPGCGEDVFVKNKDEDLGARSVKTKIYDLAPHEWDYVLYLDSDTEVVADISFLFDLLRDGWELVFCTNPAQYVLGQEMRRPDNEEECAITFKKLGTDQFLQPNGGVFSFRRSERTQRFFKAWHHEWKKYAKRDQAGLVRALYRHSMRVYILGNEWNTITRYIPPERTAGILHYPMQARRWRGMVNGRLDSSEAWAVMHPIGNKEEIK